MAALRAFQEAERWFWADPGRQMSGQLDQVGARTCIATCGLRQLGVADDGVSRWIGPFLVAERIRLLKPFPGALELLAQLRSRGVALGLVTNGTTDTQRAKIERVGLASRFDVVVIEGEFGIGKPAPEVFDHALASIDATPENAWMVGDDLERDIAGGRLAGLYTVWVDGHRTGLPEGSPAQPDRIVRSIAELAAPPRRRSPQGRESEQLPETSRNGTFR